MSLLIAVKNVCSEDEFQCSSGHCIPAKHKCDGFWDCKDAGDELQTAGCPFVECPSSHFTCNNDVSVCYYLAIASYLT